MSGAAAWRTLGIEKTEDQTAIRRAYARALKAIDPETDPGAFHALRDARDWAMHAAATGAIEDEDADAADVALDDGPLPDGAPPIAAPADALAQVPPLDVQSHLAALEQLHAMVFDPASTASYREIASQADRVLADPAMINLDHAAAVENALADLIARGTPRSDPVIDPAIAYFRWDAPETELNRPPILRWILQRVQDRHFELGLRRENPRYANLLARLRGEVPARFPRWTAWRSAPRMAFLFAFLDTHHPTVFASAPQATIDWWSAAIERQGSAGGVAGWLYEQRRLRAWDAGLGEPQRRFSIGLFLLIFFVPYVGVWFLLRDGHSLTARIMGFGWFALHVIAFLIPDAQDFAKHSGAPTAPTVALPRMIADPGLINASTDIDRLLQATFGDALKGVDVRTANPAFYAALEAAWREAKADPAPGNRDRFQVAAGQVMDRTLAAALGEGNEALLLDRARSFAIRLRWAERAGADACVDTLKGQAGDVPSDLQTYHRSLAARAILSGAAPRAAGRREARTFTIPAPIFDDALKRSRLSARAFDEASLGRGPALAQCHAAIALIDAATEAPQKGGLQVLRAMFGG